MRYLDRIVLAGLVLLVLLISAMMLAANAAEMPRAALQYRSELTRESRFVWGLVAPVSVFGAQIHQESGYDERARSKFADGLAQFTPSTAEWISGVYPRLGPPAPFSPSWAMRAMVQYDKRLYDGVRVADGVCDRFLFALSDYNGGSGRRMRRQVLSSSPGEWSATGTINPGISTGNQRENESYGPKIMFVLQPVYWGWGLSRVCL